MTIEEIIFGTLMMVGYCIVLPALLLIAIFCTIVGPACRVCQ